MIDTEDRSSFVLEDVTVSYSSVKAIDSVSLTIAKGERVAFVGPSGAGKTTLLRTLNGSVRPSNGRAIVRGKSLSELSAGELRQLRAQIGFVHQDLSLVPNQRVIRNVLAGALGRTSFAGSLRMMMFPRRAETVEIHRILKRVGVEEKLYERTDTLSGGQQQRVAIARALYQKPIALFADEPVSSVDPARAEITVSLLNEIADERSLTLCMSLHNLSLARRFFPRLVGMRHGKVVFDRSAEDLDDEQFDSLYKIDDEDLILDGRSGEG